MSPAIDTYAGALVVPLVNQLVILSKIKRAIEGGGLCVFYITAPGGMGKTYLLREVLERCQQGGDWHRDDVLAAKTEVDLYHTYIHRLEGLMGEIQEVLQPDAADHFKVYQEQSEQFEKLKYEFSRAVKALEKERSALSQTFLRSLGKLCENERIVLAFDTAEKLLYETERVQHILGTDETGFGIREWLIKDLIANLKNAVVLIAGRPEPPQLRDDLRRTLGDALVEHDLGRLAEEDALTYFQAAANTARARGLTDAAERIELIPQETRRVIWHYTQGRPIMLALLIDYLLVAGQLPAAVKVSPEQAKHILRERPDEIQQQLEENLVRSLLEADRQDNETIRSLAWARRGMDAELLARVADCRKPDGEWDVEGAQAMLDRLRSLSFVKLRQKDNRVFLHDEMYDLLQHHALDQLADAEADRVYTAILKYYEEKIERTQAEIERLQHERREEVTYDRRLVISSRPTALVDPQALNKARADLEELQIEEVHYRLRRNPLDGYEAYARNVEKAVFAHNQYLDVQFRDELLDFSKGAKGDEVVLRVVDIDFDGVIRGIQRWTMGGQPDKAQKAIQRLRTEGVDLLGGELAGTEVDIWEAQSLTYLGRDLNRAEKLLRQAIDALRTASLSGDEFQDWRRNALLSRAYSALGYLQRVQGRFLEALGEYRATFPLWRKLELGDEHANTLNNLAWALAETGQFRRALRMCQDGLDLRLDLGPRYPIALSYNTLGLIETRHDQPHRAQRHCERALSIFRDLGQERGIGLASTALAEALRRSARVPGLYFPEESADLLRLAQEYALEAVEIFENQVREPSRLIEAYLELGGIYRDWSRLRPRYPHDKDPDRAQLAAEGETALRQAAQVAQQTLPYRQVDALVNLAWLYYYVGEPEKAQQTLDEAMSPIPPEYFIVPGQGTPGRDKSVPFYWVQMGKAALLEGMMAFDEYLAYKKPKDLETAAQKYTLCLDYDDLFAQDFRDIDRAKEQIYKRMATLGNKELCSAWQAINKTKEQYQLETLRIAGFMQENFGSLEELSRGV
jgi:tetratricopeptide (TPR) repeat protein